jgi:hypothetical protein
LIINQVLGKWKVKHADLKPLAATAKALAAQFQEVRPRVDSTRRKHTVRCTREREDKGTKMTEQTLAEAKALAFALGKLSLEDIRDMVRDEVSADDAIELGKLVAKALDGRTNAEVLATGLTLLMGTLMDMASKNESSATEPRHDA